MYVILEKTLQNLFGILIVVIVTLGLKGSKFSRTKRVKMKILTLAPSKILNKMILEKIFEDKRHMSNSNFDVPQVEL